MNYAYTVDSHVTVLTLSRQRSPLPYASFDTLPPLYLLLVSYTL